jgi:hypothetical protein
VHVFSADSVHCLSQNLNLWSTDQQWSVKKISNGLSPPSGSGYFLRTNKHVICMAKSLFSHFKSCGGENVDYISLSFHSKFLKYFV